MRDYLLFYVNGKEQRVSGAEVFAPLSSYLRYGQSATGTKVVCAEGDCGACTVMIGRLSAGELAYQPVNSCIQFLHQLDCSHIVTVEGLKDKQALNPVQEAMVDNHGAQCGYCTPGIIVSLCSLFDCKQPADAQDIKDALTGNLCRCTGYESIITSGLAVDPAGIRSLKELYPEREMVAQFRSHIEQPALIEHREQSCFVPTSVKQAIEFKAKHPDTVTISGGTDVCVNCNKRGLEPAAIVSLSNLSGLSEVQIENGQLVVGGRAKLATLEAWAREEMPELYKIMWLFGSPQIRNAGTLAGNVANGSPIADSLPWLFVMEAQVELTGTSGIRLVNINSFYKGYKQLDMKADELITRIIIPLPEPQETLRLFKVSKRQNLDISAFTAAIRMTIADNKIVKAAVAYGGVGPVVLRLPKTEDFLTGKETTAATFTEAGELARSEITPISDVRGSSDFRLQLAENILLKFYYESACEREYACQV
jgi:xanthine dehydrogenase small subunit